jgi:hypothetical protein
MFNYNGRSNSSRERMMVNPYLLRREIEQERQRKEERLKEEEIQRKKAEEIKVKKTEIDARKRILRKLCSMPSCTFEAQTPEGLMLVNVDSHFEESGLGKGHTVLKKQDGSIFTKIYYSLGGGYKLYEDIEYKDDSFYPGGYILRYDDGDLNSDVISYEKDNKKIVVGNGGISVNDKRYYVDRDDAGNKTFDCQIGCGIDLKINLETNQMTLYVYLDGKPHIISISNGVDIKSMLTTLATYVKRIRTVKNFAIAKLKASYEGELGEKLCELLPEIVYTILSADDIDPNCVQEARRVLNIYKRDRQLLDSSRCYSLEILLSIEKVADEYITEYNDKKETENIEGQIAALQKRLIGKRPRLSTSSN